MKGSKKLMVQMEHWGPNDTPKGGTRPIGMSGRTLSKDSKASFHKVKHRASAFAAISAQRAAQKARAKK